jgi:hypothetical protein
MGTATKTLLLLAYRRAASEKIVIAPAATVQTHVPDSFMGVVAVPPGRKISTDEVPDT